MDRSSRTEVSLLSKCYKITIYYVAIEMKDGKKKYKGAIKSKSNEKQKDY